MPVVCYNSLFPIHLLPSLRHNSEGLWMKYHTSTTPTCTPARAAILTGQSPWQHGMLGYGNVAPWQEATAGIIDRIYTI